MDNSEQLPGYGQCGGAVNLDWVAENPVHTTLKPGASVTPYDVPSVGLTMNVTPPRGWGQVSGTITGVNCDGSTAPLPGAAVSIDPSSGQQVSVTADASGHYGYWLAKTAATLTSPTAPGSPRPRR